MSVILFIGCHRDRYELQASGDRDQFLHGKSVAQIRPEDRIKKPGLCAVNQGNMELVDEIPAGLYYIALADLVASSKFGEDTGNDAMRHRMKTFAAASQKALKNAKGAPGSNSGILAKTMGDGVIYLFKHFPDVIQWDMEFDGELHLAANHRQPFEKRVCVHAGEISVKDGEIVGLAFNQVCKMEKNVKAGQLVLTDIAHRLGAPALYSEQCEFEDYGTVKLAGSQGFTKLHRLVVKKDIWFLVDKTGSPKTFS